MSTSKRPMSVHAQVAKRCRQYCKSIGLKVRATSDTFAGGNSVNVEVYDLPPAKFKQVKSEFEQYQAGHFNGMEDIYEYSNRRKDIPQVKYLSVRNHHSVELEQEAWEFTRKHFREAGEACEVYKDVSNSVRVWERWASDFIYQLLSGSVSKYSDQFWSEKLAKDTPAPVEAKSGQAPGKPADEPVDDITINEGSKSGFVEIRFPGKPSDMVRTELKESGFRWSRFNKCWYGKEISLPATYLEAI